MNPDLAPDLAFDTMQPAHANLKNTYIKGGEPFFIEKKSDTAILLLHGFTDTPYQLQDMGLYLAEKGMTVYAPIIAGHGTSPEHLAKTSIRDWVESVEKALQFLKERAKNVIIVGNSFGGNLALNMAAKYNNPLAGVVSIGAPITLRYHKWILIRLYLYGWFKKFYRKPSRHYKIDYIQQTGVINYPVIPVKSLRDFFRFIHKHTIPILHKIKSPALIIQADADPIVHPKSVQQLHEKIGSDYKKVYWLNDNQHTIIRTDTKKDEIFKRVHEFIMDVQKMAQDNMK